MVLDYQMGLFAGEDYSLGLTLPGLRTHRIPSSSLACVLVVSLFKFSLCGDVDVQRVFTKTSDLTEDMDKQASGSIFSQFSEH